jgi:hypothetical protein
MTFPVGQSARPASGVVHKIGQAGSTMHQREPNGMKAPNCAPNWPIVLMLRTEKVWQNQLADEAV